MSRLFSAVSFVLFFFFSCLSNAASDISTVKAVASFSVLADWVEKVGGEHVDVLSLVGLDEDVHVYQASPADLRTVADADVMFVNGLGLEGWLDRLIETSGFKGRVVVVSDGVAVIDSDSSADTHGTDEGHHADDHHDSHDEPHHDASESHENHDDHAEHDDHDHHTEHDDHDAHSPHESHDADRTHHEDHDEHDHGSTDPHAWLSPKMARVYISNISQTLLSLSAGESFQRDIKTNTAAYLAELNDLNGWIQQKLQAVPVSQRNTVVPHNAFAYLARDYQLTFHSLQGNTSESEASAAAFASVVRKIRQQKITSIFGENTGNDKLIKRVAAEANLPLAGFLMSGALSSELAPTYLDMMRYNASQLLRSMQAE